MLDKVLARFVVATAIAQFIVGARTADREGVVEFGALVGRDDNLGCHGIGDDPKAAIVRGAIVFRHLEFGFDRAFRLRADSGARIAARDTTFNFVAEQRKIVVESPVGFGNRYEAETIC